jgi:hypothetical protein
VDPDLLEAHRHAPDRPGSKEKSRPKTVQPTRNCMNPRQRGEHLFRSRKQHAASTCNLSRAGPDTWVHVRGRPCPSVVVDVPTDVDREALRSWALTGGLPCCRPSRAQPQQFLRPAIPKAWPPGEGMIWSGRGAFADVAAAETTPTRTLAVGMGLHLRRRLSMLVDVGWCWVMRFVPDLFPGTARPNAPSQP